MRRSEVSIPGETVYRIVRQIDMAKDKRCNLCPMAFDPA
jgi:hypothetical protein